MSDNVQQQGTSGRHWDDLGAWMTLKNAGRALWTSRHAGGYEDWKAAPAGQRAEFVEELARLEKERAEKAFQEYLAKVAAISAAFPPPTHHLKHEELRQLGRFMVRDRSLLKRNALVIYRCGAKRPNGKMRGCLLGAVVNLKGDRYWVHQQRTTIDHMSSYQVEACLHGHGDWGDLTNEVLDRSLTWDNEIVEWQPDTIREAIKFDLVSGGYASVFLHVHPADTLVHAHEYQILGMNCPHTDVRREPLEIVHDIERLSRQTDKTVYL